MTITINNDTFNVQLHFVFDDVKYYPWTIKSRTKLLSSCPESLRSETHYTTKASLEITGQKTALAKAQGIFDQIKEDAPFFSILKTEQIEDTSIFACILEGEARCEERIHPAISLTLERLGLTEEKSKEMIQSAIKTAEDLQGISPLFKAVAPYTQNPSQDIDALVSQGVNLNVRDSKGDTPLHYAAYVTTPEQASALLKYSLHPNPKR